jgi:hypothetical protein
MAMAVANSDAALAARLIKETLGEGFDYEIIE